MESLALWLVPVLAGAGVLVLTCKSELLWRLHAVLSDLAAALLVVGLPFIFVAGLPLVATTVLTMTVAWLLLLAARLRFGRLDKPFLRTSTVGNVYVVGLLFLVTALWVCFLPVVELSIIGAVLLVVSVLTGVIFVCQAIWSYKHYAVKGGAPQGLKDLPTVSLCIPARNETAALHDCLAAAVASDYPKLEILVLDDCSHDKTSEIILDFAQDGVRFVKGDLPADGWLGRNQAMSTLAHHATGEYLVFMSVDTRLSPHSITQAVGYARQRASMVSVLPVSDKGFSVSAVLATLRYYWQIVLPISARHVPVSSKLWLINAKSLKSLGGFESVKHKIVPEASFAKRLYDKNEYRFIIGDRSLGLTTEKSWRDQVSTSLRLIYPQLRRQPVVSLALVLVLTGVFAMPFIALAALLVVGSFGLHFWLAVAAVVLHTLAYGLVISRLQPQSWSASVLALPILFLQEAALTAISMLAYEFSEVNWKGRNVCYPVISRGQRSQPVASELGRRSHA